MSKVSSTQDKDLVAIVWFRQDLRIRDNPALKAALNNGMRVFPLFIWAPNEENSWAPGAASRWWLHYSLKSLKHDLLQLGLDLTIRSGETLEILRNLIHETNATSIYWNRRYEPSVIKRDAFIKTTLKGQGIHVESFKANLLFEPHEISTKENKPFQVFTPFWKKCLSFEEKIAQPLPFLSKQNISLKTISSLEVDQLELLPKIHWDNGLQMQWKPGAGNGERLLLQFIANGLQDYPKMRDFPGVSGVSHLSPYLHFGEISPQFIWKSVKDAATKSSDKQFTAASEAFLRQLGWREFAHHLLYHFPQTTDYPLRKEFSAFPWKDDSSHLKAWQKGNTGYPIVDAGMRELWTTGWMHNRVRMIVGSFLVKDLLIPWQEGAKWFWDTLVDADLANNSLGWQWVAGCGADAAPYFRIFNPVTQGEKFDPQGSYVRRWIPELSQLPDKWIQCPWEAPDHVLRGAGVVLGDNYPAPLVNHDEARKHALQAFQDLKSLG